MLKGIDVSKWQATIDWDKVKSQIDFAILRCGYGSDFTNQDDAYFERNANECERLGIPYGVYLYSYAQTPQMISSEIGHTLRLINNRKPFCVYIDMEDAKTVSVGKQGLTDFANKFCTEITAHGYKAGVYANENWCKNYIDIASIKANGYSIWCAKYSTNKPVIKAEYDIWQYSDKGKINGISGNVDMNEMIIDIINKPEPVKEQEVIKKSVEEIAQEVCAGLWGNGDERKTRLTEAGYNYAEVQAVVNKICGAPTKKSNEEIAKEVYAGKWGNNPERRQKLEAAGYDYTAIQKLVNKMCK